MPNGRYIRLNPLAKSNAILADGRYSLFLLSRRVTLFPVPPRRSDIRDTENNSNTSLRDLEVRQPRTRDVKQNQSRSYEESSTVWYGMWTGKGLQVGVGDPKNVALVHAGKPSWIRLEFVR